jgi:hypothetical protein
VLHKDRQGGKTTTQLKIRAFYGCPRVAYVDCKRVVENVILSPQAEIAPSRVVEEIKTILKAAGMDPTTTSSQSWNFLG